MKSNLIGTLHPEAMFNDSVPVKEAKLNDVYLRFMYICMDSILLKYN